MARVVLATMGTWGDLFPVIGLARGLSAVGHDVQVTASGAYEELVRAEGLGFASVGPALSFADYSSDPKILSGRLGGFAGFAHLFARFIFPALDQFVDDLAGAIAGADLVLAHPAQVAAPIAAEHAGVRWGTISVFPGLIPTAFAPPAPTRISVGDGRAARALHRATWSIARFNMARLFDSPVNRARRRLGLPATRNCFIAPVTSGRPYLVMASPAVIERPADWPQNVALTGFVAWDRPRSFPDPAGLEEFLSSGEPPVLVTLGASSSLDPRDFYGDGPVTRLGHRALLLTGPTPGRVELPDDPRIFSVPFAPLSLVAPRSLAAIHHGGVGTTIQLLSAGLPQVVVPRGFDQPHTAARMAGLGVARAVPWRRATSARLSSELGALLGDRRYRANATALQARLAGEDGLAETVRMIEQILRD
jgi:rhamnosyltransferase subunit B